MTRENDGSGGNESTFRTAWAGHWLLGALALGVLSYFDVPLVGVGIYVVAAIAAIALWIRYPTTLFDERDLSIHRQAGGRTLYLLAIGSAVVFPTLVALWGFGLFEWGPWTTASAFLVAAIFAVYFVATVSLAHQ